MSKREAVIHYKAAAAVFKRWLSAGIIAEAEFALINAKTAEKYGLDSTSIFFEIPLN